MITYQRKSVTTTATQLTPPAGAVKAELQFEGSDARFTYDRTTTPTTGGPVGNKASDGGSFTLNTPEEIRNFRIVSTGTTYINIHYFDGRVES